MFPEAKAEKFLELVQFGPGRMDFDFYGDAHSGSHATCTGRPTRRDTAGSVISYFHQLYPLSESL